LVDASAAKQVSIFARGVSRGDGVGAYGVVLLCDGKSRELSGAEPSSSNNRMDIAAAIAGLEALTRPCRVTLLNNNTYLVDAIAKGWAAKWRARGWRNAENEPTSHADLWERLLDLCAKHDVWFMYRAVDTGSPELQRCDEIARSAIGQLGA
jgi:ribonuclease HI